MEDPLKSAQLSESIPVHYFNGFAISFGQADFTMTVKQDNRDLFHLKGSYTITKTLAEKLDFSLKRFEDIVGQKMLTTDQVEAAIKKAASPDQVEAAIKKVASPEGKE
jgi:hypothetical protein